MPDVMDLIAGSADKVMSYMGQQEAEQVTAPKVSPAVAEPVDPAPSAVLTDDAIFEGAASLRRARNAQAMSEVKQQAKMFAETYRMKHAVDWAKQEKQDPRKFKGDDALYRAYQDSFFQALWKDRLTDLGEDEEAERILAENTSYLEGVRAEMAKWAFRSLHSMFGAASAVYDTAKEFIPLAQDNSDLLREQRDLWNLSLQQVEDGYRTGKYDQYTAFVLSTAAEIAATGGVGKVASGLSRSLASKMGFGRLATAMAERAAVSGAMSSAMVAMHFPHDLITRLDSGMTYGDALMELGTDAAIEIMLTTAIGMVVPGAEKIGLNKSLRPQVGKRAMAIIADAAGESFEEGTVTFAQIIARRLRNGIDLNIPLTDEETNEIKMAMAVGGTVGGALPAIHQAGAAIDESRPGMVIEKPSAGERRRQAEENQELRQRAEAAEAALVAEQAAAGVAAPVDVPAGVGTVAAPDAAGMATEAVAGDTVAPVAPEAVRAPVQAEQAQKQREAAAVTQEVLKVTEPAQPRGQADEQAQGVIRRIFGRARIQTAGGRQRIILPNNFVIDLDVRSREQILGAMTEPEFDALKASYPKTHAIQKVAYADRAGLDVGGSFAPSQRGSGTSVLGLLTLVKGEADSGTVFHEAFHVFSRSGMMNPREYQVLAEHYLKERRRNGESPDAFMSRTEEGIALALQNDVTPKARGVISRMIEFAKHLIRRAVGNMNADDVLNMMRSGAMASRTPSLQGEGAAFQIRGAVHEDTGLPLNDDGTVTVWHHTSKQAASAIMASGRLSAKAEADVYVTTEQFPTTGYGDAAVAIKVDPSLLILDDEFPSGRRDFRLRTGKPGGSIGVVVDKAKTNYQIRDTIDVDGTERPTTNSNGQPIARTEEAVRNFWRWFGDSIGTEDLTDDGTPFVFYRGASARSITDGSNGVVFLTPIRSDAVQYASLTSKARFGERGVVADQKLVYDVYLKFSNPIVLPLEMSETLHNGPNLLMTSDHDAVIGIEDALYAEWKEYASDKGMSVTEAFLSSVMDWTDVTEVVSLDPYTQIKSTTGNVGTFDPSNPSINYQIRDEPTRLFQAKLDERYGRPDLANPAINPESRKMVDVADSILEHHRWVEENRKTMEAQAQQIAEAALADPFKAKNALMQKIDQWQATGEATFGPADTIIGKALVGMAWDAYVEGGKSLENDQGFMEAAWIQEAYRRMGTAQSDALRLRFDPIETPAERHKRTFMEDILMPPRSIQLRINNARKRGDKRVVGDLMRRWSAKAESIFYRMRQMGMDPRKMTDADWANFGNVRKLLRVKQAASASFWTKAEEYWRNSVLSGVLTHTTNTVGNMAFMASALGPERVVSALVGDSIRTLDRLLGRKKTRIHSATMQEIVPMMKAMFKAIPRATTFAMQSFITETPVFSSQVAGQDLTQVDVSKVAIGGGKGRWLRGPQRALTAADEFAKAIIGEAHATAVAVRLAKAKGIKPGTAAFQAFLEQELSNLDSLSWQEAVDLSTEITFQKPSKLTKLAADIRAWDVNFMVKILSAGDVDYVPGIGEFRPLYYVIPFITVPTNLALIGAVRAPIIGDSIMLAQAFRAMVLGHDVDVGKHVAQQMLTWGMVMAVTQLIGAPDDDDKWITGSNPYQRGKSAMTPPPFSIRFGETWYSYKRIEPFSTVLGVVTDMVDHLKHGGDDMDIGNMFAAAKTSIMENITEKTFMTGLKDLIDLFDAEKGPGRAENWARNFAVSWLPNLIRQPIRQARDISPMRRVWDAEGAGLLDRIAQSTEILPLMGVLPLLGIGEPDRPNRDVFGREFPSQASVNHWLWNQLVPIRTEPVTFKATNGHLFVNRYNTLYPDKEWYPSYNGIRSYTHNGESKDFTPEQLDRHVARAGKMALDLVDDMVKRGILDVNAPTDQQLADIQDAMSAAYGWSRADMVAEIHGGQKTPARMRALEREILLERRWDSTLRQMTEAAKEGVLDAAELDRWTKKHADRVARVRNLRRVKSLFTKAQKAGRAAEFDREYGLALDEMLR